MRRAIVATIGFNLFLVAALFLPARRLDWPAGWALIALFVLFGVVGLLILPPELIEERTSGQPDARLRDLVPATLAFLFIYPFTFIVCGRDFRFGWSPDLPLILRALAFTVAIAGYAFSMWAAHSNPFFSTVVRIQRERGHRVIDHGPYALVRHPGYAGPVVAHLAIPVALGCLWGLIPAVIGITFLALRASYEEQRLALELEGYREYRERVRWRFFPGIW
jgi:protein-S-isoprenylcysteine O-methyltransferase Ste14